MTILYILRLAMELFSDIRMLASIAMLLAAVCLPTDASCPGCPEQVRDKATNKQSALITTLVSGEQPECSPGSSGSLGGAGAPDGGGGLS